MGRSPIQDRRMISCPRRNRDVPGQVSIDGIVRDSLEEVELSFSTVGDREVDIVKSLLLSCGAALRSLVIRASCEAPMLSTTTRETITSFCRPETSIKFYGC
ncbi:hypothetical protein ACP70R_005660 [Stipagrostis hirtigluma subsp. patula]